MIRGYVLMRSLPVPSGQMIALSASVQKHQALVLVSVPLVELRLLFLVSPVEMKYFRDAIFYMRTPVLRVVSNDHLAFAPIPIYLLSYLLLSQVLSDRPELMLVEGKYGENFVVRWVSFKLDQLGPSETDILTMIILLKDPIWLEVQDFANSEYT